MDFWQTILFGKSVEPAVASIGFTAVLDMGIGFTHHKVSADVNSIALKVDVIPSIIFVKRGAIYSLVIFGQLMVNCAAINCIGLHWA